jgi:hypothetical protein
MPFVIRADLDYLLLTSGLPHHVHVEHYGRPTITASNLLILGFSAASGMSAEHFCSRFHASASRSHALASHSHALALHSRASALLSHAFQQFSLTSASAIHKISNCLGLAPGRTSKNHSKASRAMQQQAMRSVTPR